MQLFKIKKNIKPRFSFLLVCLGPFIIIYLFYFLLMDFYIYPYANPRVARAKASFDHAKLYSHKFVDYLILGDSISLYGIIPKGLTANSTSFSLIASSLFSTSKILKQANNIKIKKGIILTQSFISDHYDQDVWGLFVPTSLYNYDEVLNLLCDNNECKWHEHILFDLKYVMAKSYFSDMGSNYFRERLEYLSLRHDKLYEHFMEILKENKGHYVRRGTLMSSREMFLLPYFKHFSVAVPKIPAAEFKALIELIKFASDQNIKVYYVIMPTAAGAMKVSTKSYRESVINQLRHFVSEHFEIVDTSYYEKQLSLNDFWDFSHLNSFGAQKFTEHLNERIKQLENRVRL